MLMTAVRKKNHSTYNISISRGCVNETVKIDAHLLSTMYKSALNPHAKKFFIDKVTGGCSDNRKLAQKLLKSDFPFPAVVLLENAELTKLMLDCGCPVNSRMRCSGKTALHLAVENLDVENVKVLVRRGADINAEDLRKRMPLHRFRMVAEDDHEKLEILKFLIGNGASLTTRSAKFQGHYYQCDPGQSVLGKLLSEGDNRTIEYLVSCVDLFEKDEEGKTPLHHTIKSKNPDVLEFFRDKSYDINARDSDGRTPLDFAVFRVDLEKVRFLLENGASPNNLDEIGNPAMKYILMYLPGSEKARNIIELLLLYDADPRILMCNHDNAIALGSAMETDFEFAKLLIAHLAKFESFGVPLNEFMDEKIRSNSTFEDCFDSCKKQIEKMKVTSIYESVTLYKLFSEKKEKLFMYARNEEFQSNYEAVKNNECDVDSYFVNSITMRVDEAIAIAKLKSKAAHVVCQLCELPFTMASTIGEKIVAYLSQKDLETMSEIWCTATRIYVRDGCNVRSEIEISCINKSEH